MKSTSNRCAREKCKQKKYDRCKHIDLCIAGKLRIQDQNIDMKIYKTT